MTDRPSEKAKQSGATARRGRPRVAADSLRTEGFGSFELDLPTGEARYSEGVRRILAAPADAALTRELLLERVHPEDRDVLEAALARTRRDGESLCLEIRIRRFDDLERVVRARGEVMAGSGDATPAKLVGTLQDATEEVQERSVRDLLSAVVESTADAIITKA